MTNVMIIEIRAIGALISLISQLVHQVSGQGVLTTSVPFTSAQQIEMVDRHNRLRATVGSSNMKEMAWDPFLANFAQRQANRCDTKHSAITDRIRQGVYTYLGENNAWGNQGQLPDVGLIADAWAREAAFYTAGSAFPTGCVAGQICGHYTQMVWADTCRVGCAGALCSNIDNGGAVTSGYMVVCNYGPGGNIAGTLPYKTGAACSACTEAGNCATTQLCGSSKCPEAAGASTLAPPIPTTIGPRCTNQHPLCPYWAQLGECNSNRFWMDHYCGGSCNECPKVILSPEPACKDHEYHFGECAAWQKDGICLKHPFYMGWQCRKTCGLCRPSNQTTTPEGTIYGSLTAPGSYASMPTGYGQKPTSQFALSGYSQPSGGGYSPQQMPQQYGRVVSSYGNPGNQAPSPTNGGYMQPTMPAIRPIQPANGYHTQIVPPTMQQPTYGNMPPNMPQPGYGIMPSNMPQPAYGAMPSNVQQPAYGHMPQRAMVVNQPFYAVNDKGYIRLPVGNQESTVTPSLGGGYGHATSSPTPLLSTTPSPTNYTQNSTNTQSMGYATAAPAMTTQSQGYIQIPMGGYGPQSPKMSYGEMFKSQDIYNRHFGGPLPPKELLQANVAGPISHRLTPYLKAPGSYNKR